MTATVSQACQALADQLAASIDGLSAYANDTGIIEAPAVVVETDPGDFLTYQVAQGGTHDLGLVIGLFVQLGDNPSAYADLDAYLADEGARSIYAAVEADPTLGGVIDSAAVVSARNRGKFKYNGIEYLGCEFPVAVLL